jgi:hypothetical protein
MPAPAPPPYVSAAPASAPVRPVPRAVAPWVPVAMPVLAAPVWGQQTALGETEHEYAAFTVWLSSTDMLEAARAVQLREHDLVELAERYSWQVRKREYWQHARVEGAAAIREEQAPARESRALARELVNKSLALALLEVEKATAEAMLAQGAPPRDGPPRLFSNRELVQWVRTVAGLDVMRERAGLATGATGTDDAPALDWERCNGDELEAYRLAREKALGR